MSEDYIDPSGSTEQFRAFVQNPEPTAERRPASRYLALAVVAAVIVVAAIVAMFAVR